MTQATAVEKASPSQGQWEWDYMGIIENQPWPAGQGWSRDRAPLVKGCGEGAALKQEPWQSNNSV